MQENLPTVTPIIVYLYCDFTVLRMAVEHTGSDTVQTMLFQQCFFTNDL